MRFPLCWPLFVASWLGCSSAKLGPDPEALDRAPAVVLLAELGEAGVTVGGVVGGPQTVDLDDDVDGREGFRLEVLRGEQVVHERTTNGPLLVKTFLEYWGGVSGVDILSALPTLGRFPIQVPLIDGADVVRFSVRDADGVYQDAGLFDLRKVDELMRPASTRDIGRETLHDNGPSENRLDIVIVGDGFTAEEMDGFRKLADRIADRLLETPPFEDVRDYINIHRLDVVSNESGVSYDCDPVCRVKDIAFGSIFPVEIVNLATGTNYSTRSIFQADQWGVAEAVSVLPWDFVLVLANTTRSGGMAVHYATATSGQDDVVETSIHELGHTIGLLGDEYVTDDCIRSQALGWPVNVAEDPTSPPWLHWVEDETPLPTQEDDVPAGTVGAYAGNFNCDDLYRPLPSCMMRDYDDFCPVCAEALLRRVFRFVDPVDGVRVAGSQVVLDGPRGDLPVTWKVDGEVTGPALSGLALELEGRPEKVEAVVRFATDKVREGEAVLEQRLVVVPVDND